MDDKAADSADQPAGAERPELPGHSEAKVVVVVQISFFLLPLDALAVLEELPLRAAFVTAGLIVGTGTLTGKHDRHLSHKTRLLS